MEAYKYILDCPKCNYHLLFNESDTSIETSNVGYSCELYTKAKSALNKIYYISFHTLEELIGIINYYSKKVVSVYDNIKITKYVVCPNCGEKIILKSKTFAAKNTHQYVDLYNWKLYFVNDIKELL